MAHKTATFVKLLNKRQALFKINDHVAYDIMLDNGEYATMWTNYIVSSKGRVKETLLFPADQNGTILVFGELKGSIYEEYDFLMPLINAGYTIINGEALKILYQDIQND